MNGSLIMMTTPEYEGKIIYGGTEYEFTIDASTGSVMEWDAEKVR